MEEQGGEDEFASEFVREVCSILDAKRGSKFPWENLVFDSYCLCKPRFRYGFSNTLLNKHLKAV